jgi:fluoride exporter
MFPQLLYVALGGALGSVVRYLTNVMFLKFSTVHTSVATLLVNVLGSFIIGFVFANNYFVSKNEALQLFLITGFCGGLTTFSGLVFDFNALNKIQFTYSILFLTSNIILGLLFFTIGMHSKF